MKRIVLLSTSLVYILLLNSQIVTAQEINYGDNESSGKYIQRDDAKIYYESYGEGPPLILLHGDFFGYISEFSRYYPILMQHFRVIAVARRGHGKSEMGNQTFSVKLFADDVIAIMNQEGIPTASVVGFSAGATTAYYLAAYYPERISKVVAMAGFVNNKKQTDEEKRRITDTNFSEIAADDADLIKQRRALMPQPARFEELLERLKVMWMEDVAIPDEKVKNIKVSVMVLIGDRDENRSVERYVDIYRSIPKAQLAVIPECGHVGLILRPEMFKAIVMPFLTRAEKL